jgi:hypothetical protein
LIQTGAKALAYGSVLLTLLQTYPTKPIQPSRSAATLFRKQSAFPNEDQSKESAGRPEQNLGRAIGHSDAVTW